MLNGGDRRSEGVFDLKCLERLKGCFVDRIRNRDLIGSCEIR